MIVKLYQGSLRLGVGENFCTKRIIKHWNRLPWEVVKSSSLEELKRYVGVALEDVA